MGDGRAQRGATPDRWLLAVALRPQEWPRWCWAACGEMAMEFLGRRVRQCEQVNMHFAGMLGELDCCATPEKCQDYAGYPDFGKFGFACTETFSPLDWEGVRAQIYGEGKPFVYSYARLGGEHMVVAVGYAESAAGDRFLIINDPEPVDEGMVREVWYEEYARDHLRTYCDLVNEGAKHLH